MQNEHVRIEPREGGIKVVDRKTGEVELEAYLADGGRQPFICLLGLGGSLLLNSATVDSAGAVEGGGCDCCLRLAMRNNSLLRFASHITINGRSTWDGAKVSHAVLDLLRRFWAQEEKRAFVLEGAFSIIPVIEYPEEEDCLPAQEAMPAVIH